MRRQLDECHFLKFRARLLFELDIKTKLLFPSVSPRMYSQIGFSLLLTYIYIMSWEKIRVFLFYKFFRYV